MASKKAMRMARKMPAWCRALLERGVDALEEIATEIDREMGGGDADCIPTQTGTLSNEAPASSEDDNSGGG